MHPAITTATNSSERHVEISELEHSLIRHVRSRICVFFYEADVPGRLREMVDCERFGPWGDFLDKIRKVVVVENWQEGSEDLFFHHQWVFAGLFDDSRADEPGILLYRASIDYLSFMLIIEQLLYSFQVELIHNFSIISLSLNVLISPIKLVQFQQKKLLESCPMRFMNIDVVYSDTSLTAVEEFSNQDSVYRCV